MKRDCVVKSVELLEAAGSKLKDSRIVFGFDGFVDIIVRPVKKGDSLNVEELYSSIGEFGSFLVERSGKSCSIELKEYDTKIGGNTPICANALGTLGAQVSCIGAFGYPERHPVFNGMSANCELITVENPGICTALEFNDGKVMLAMNNGTNSLNWDIVKERAGIGHIISKLSSSDLLGLFNWSELPGATSVWRGMLNEVVPHIGEGKWALFDFSDCSRKSENELVEALDIISSFGKKFKTVLSMNENEARAVCDAILEEKGLSLDAVGLKILKRLDVYGVIFHLHDRSIAFDASGVSLFNTYLIEKPTVTTGAGDNFNAGLCAALLFGMNMPEALATASLTASFYVAKGRSPELSELIGFMKEKLTKLCCNFK